MDKTKRTRKKRPEVVSAHGQYRFQTGMVTATLLHRGLSIDQAFQISRELRDSIAGLDTVTTDELEAGLERLLKKRGIKARWPAAVFPASPERRILVRGPEGTRDLERSQLLRDLFAAGVHLESAARIVNTVVRDIGDEEIDEGALEILISEAMRARVSPAHARRYRLTRWLRRADKPVIILIGGATGTGKSTLAMELAFRLGIRLATSTDMIRETMRTVLSPEVVPGLHDHSFRGIVQGGDALTDMRERVLAGFGQQAAQVAVGIRGVIRRAIRERAHMIIEGTHIVPPYEQYLPAGSPVHHAGMTLAVLEEQRHAERFPTRARTQTGRDASTYLESFQSVRWIHDYLLQSAEDEESVVLAPAEVGATANLAIEYLSHVLPIDAEETGPPRTPRDVKPSGPKTLLLVIDGMSDVPIPDLGGVTPLAAAHTPWLDRLAACGSLGRIRTGQTEGDAPETDEGLAALFFGPDAPTFGRGLVEAIGLGIPLPARAVVFRGNLATGHDDGSLTDRRAGRIRTGVAELVSDLRNVALSNGVRGTVHAGSEHRVLVVLHGSGLSPAVSDTDPGSDAAVQRALPPRATVDSPEASRTVDALRELLALAHKHLSNHPLNAARIEQGLLPANMILTRGASKMAGSASGPAGGRAIVAACPTAIGLGRLAGMRVTTSAAMTGNLDTDLDQKFNAAADLFNLVRDVVVHVKGTDIAAHDQQPLVKRDFLARVDAALGHLLQRDESIGLRVVVSADHGTSSITGDHIADPVPVLVSTWDGTEESAAFSEEAAATGELGLLEPGGLETLLRA